MGNAATFTSKRAVLGVIRGNSKKETESSEKMTTRKNWTKPMSNKVSLTPAARTRNPTYKVTKRSSTVGSIPLHKQAAGTKTPQAKTPTEAGKERRMSAAIADDRDLLVETKLSETSESIMAAIEKIDNTDAVANTRANTTTKLTSIDDAQLIPDTKTDSPETTITTDSTLTNTNAMVDAKENSTESAHIEGINATTKMHKGKAKIKKLTPIAKAKTKTENIDDMYDDIVNNTVADEHLNTKDVETKISTNTTTTPAVIPSTTKTTATTALTKIKAGGKGKGKAPGAGEGVRGGEDIGQVTKKVVAGPKSCGGGRKKHTDSIENEITNVLDSYFQSETHKESLTSTESARDRMQQELETQKRKVRRHESTLRQHLSSQSQKELPDPSEDAKTLDIEHMLQVERDMLRQLRAAQKALQIADAWFQKADLVARGGMLGSTRVAENFHKRGSKRNDMVFLGGSCNPTTWRKDIAVPMLTEACIPFFNPQVDEWYPELIDLENRAKEESVLLFFVIDGQTRAMVSMNEVTELICGGRMVVLVVQDIKQGTKVGGVEMDTRQIKDLNRARAYIRNSAERNGVPLFKSVKMAIESVCNLPFWAKSKMVKQARMERQAQQAKQLAAERRRWRSKHANKQRPKIEKCDSIGHKAQKIELAAERETMMKIAAEPKKATVKIQTRVSAYDMSEHNSLTCKYEGCNNPTIGSKHYCRAHRGLIKPDADTETFLRKYKSKRRKKTDDESA